MLLVWSAFAAPWIVLESVCRLSENPLTLCSQVVDQHSEFVCSDAGVERLPPKKAFFTRAPTTHRQRFPAAPVEPLYASLPSMPWRHLIFPSEGASPHSIEHFMSSLKAPATHDCTPPTPRLALTTLASSSFNRPSRVAMESIAELSEEVAGMSGEVDTFQRRASPVTTGPLAGASSSSPAFAAPGAYDASKFQRRASPASTSPSLSLSESLDLLHLERGDDAGGLDASICSCAADLGKDGAACVCKHPEHKRGAPDLGMDVVA